MKALLVILSSLFVASTASAQLVFAPGITYQSGKLTETTPGTIDSDISGLATDLRIGYVLPMGLYLGGMYSMTSGMATPGLGFLDDASGNTFGPTIGYYSMMGFYTLFTYHIMGESSVDIAGTEVKYTGAKGPQVDVGWVFPISSFFSIGPQLTWRSVEFDKYEAGTTSVDTDNKDTDISPTISLWFMF